MTEHAHHFESFQQQQEAVTLGMWLFLVTELLLFGGLLLGYAVYRLYYGEVFAEASRHMDLWLGSLNTLVLLTSSLVMAGAVATIRGGRRGLTALLLVATALLGVVFLGIKGVEYYKEFQEGLVPLPGLQFHFPGSHPEHAQLFFNFYFTLTGLHALHLTIGLGLLGGMAWVVLRRTDSRRLVPKVEVVGLYWHFVDVVWVFLFPIFYLVR